MTKLFLLAIFSSVFLTFCAANGQDGRTVNACSCSSGFIEVDVDVQGAVDPSQLVLLNSTALRRIKRSFNVFGKLCQPIRTGGSAKGHEPVQLLLHGFIYNSQYWDVQWNGFQNYSYMEYACSQGVSSFAYDNICAGRSIPGSSSQDCQLPPAAEIASSLGRKLKDGSISATLTGKKVPFSRVFAIGHSLGSAVLYYSTLRDGKSTPFTGMILTGYHHTPAEIENVNLTISTIIPAAIADPGRWGTLDSGYVTMNTTVRKVFYGPPGTFDPVVFQIDDLTRDLSSLWIENQAFLGNLDPATPFKGPVTLIVGGAEPFACMPCDPVGLRNAQKPFFPNADLKAVIIPGQGHVLNLEFGAAQTFSTMVNLFKQATN